MELVETIEDISSNLVLFDLYRQSSQSDEQEFYLQRLRLGKIFVWYSDNERVLFCPSRYAGYKENTMHKHQAFEYKSGSETTPRISRILKISHEADAEAEDAYLGVCREIGAEPSAKERTYWKIDTIASPPVKLSSTSEFPDEMAANEYPEGAVQKVLVNAYERNPNARTACIQQYKAACVVCDLNFEDIYGVIGRGFIHVHHINPIAMRQTEYFVDPIQDLRPVCPNCHAMLHKSNPPFTIEELRELMTRANLER